MITDEQFKKLKVGEWFFAVTQKDNNPFEQPFIRKFQIIEFMEINGKMSAITSKTDKIGRHWIFRPRTMHLTYEDALVEKKQVLEKIKKFEKEQEERNKIYFAEQKAREKQRQEEHDNQIRAEERKKIVQEIRDLAGDYFEMPYCDACGNTDFNDVVLTGKDLTEILDDVERGE